MHASAGLLPSRASARPAILLAAALAAALAVASCSRPPGAPEETGARLQAARRAFALDRNDEAMGEARAALAVDPDCVEAWILLGDIASLSRNHATAAENYNQALAAETRRPSLTAEERCGLITELGRSLSASNQFDAAEGTFMTGIGECPRRTSDYRYGLARIYHRTKRVELIPGMLEQAFSAAREDGTLGQKILSASREFSDLQDDPGFSEILARWTRAIPSAEGEGPAPGGSSN